MRRYATAILLPAAAYFAAGQSSHLLFLPAGFLNVIWLPAGVALAAVLLIGYRATLGVALGAGMLHVWDSLATAIASSIDETLLVAVGLGVTTAAQAALGTWLVRRYVGSPGPLDSIRDIGLFMALGGAVGCLVNPSLGLGLIHLVSPSPSGDFLESFGMWWLGGVIGVVILTPVICTFFAEPRQIWRSRRVHFALPLAGCLALAIISFAVSSQRGTEHLIHDLQQKAARFADELAWQLAAELERAHAMARLREARGQVDPEVASLPAHRVYLATPADEVIEVRILGAIPGALDAAKAALARGGGAITAPIDLRIEGSMQHVPLVLWPIFEPGAPRQSAKERRQSLRGFVGRPMIVSTVVDHALHRMQANGLSVQLWERSDPDRALPLYSQAPGAPIEPRYRVRAAREVAGHRVHVELAPTRAALQSMRSWPTPAGLTLDLLITAFLGALLLLVTGHRARSEEQVAMQADALEQTEFLRRLVDADIIGIMVTDLLGNVYEANDAILDIIGYSREDLDAGRIRWATLTPPEHVERDLVAVAQVKESGVALAWEKEYLRKDGTRVPVMVGAASIEGVEDRQVSFIADLSKVKQAEAELKRQAIEQKLLAERQAALVDAIPDVLFRIRADGMYLDIKNSRGNWLLADASQIIGTNLREDPLPREVQEEYMRVIRAAIHTGEVQEIEYELETPRGIQHFEARVVKSGRDEVVALVRNITEARRTRAALEEANYRLSAVNEELREFASVTSHDLQEPLRTMRGFVDLLARHYGDAFDEKGRKWLAHIANGAQRMRALIDDLLAYSRVGRVGEVEEVDLRALLDDILQDSHASIEAAGAEVEVGRLPTLAANPTELWQVFQNLISNALKFRRPDITPRVTISAEPARNGWAFTVADNGIGIRAEHHERIFQVFQRLHTREQYPGTGIGLALVKKIIARQGGAISVRSTPGEGTAFHFTLPARPRLPSVPPEADPS